MLKLQNFDRRSFWYNAKDDGKYNWGEFWEEPWVIGWGMLAYDVGMTFYNTQQIYNSITNGK
jgi:hypothetical protein